VVCGAPRNAIIFRASDVMKPFVTRNAELLGMLAPQFEQELEQADLDENFLDRVRIAIQEKLTGKRPCPLPRGSAWVPNGRTLKAPVKSRYLNGMTLAGT
jgi:hypothetical protein